MATDHVEGEETPWYLDDPRLEVAFASAKMYHELREILPSRRCPIVFPGDVCLRAKGEHHIHAEIDEDEHGFFALIYFVYDWLQEVEE